MKLHNILVNAKYEEKLLKRSWLFKIFFFLSISAISYMLMMEYTPIIRPQRQNWQFIALPSFIPFAATYYYNFAQAVILIFLSGTFLKRGQKLDTTEVFMVRPMSNTDYILGKIWGITKVFLGINVIVLLIAIFLNVAVNQSVFDPVPYVFYFITISIPTLIFVLGLSFVVVNIVKNQAVTIVILLGILGVIIFQFAEKYHGILDIFGINIPSTFSEINGMAEQTLFLLQRGCYFLVGCGLICLTIVSLNRLPERKSSIILNISLGTVFIVMGALLGGEYIRVFNDRQTRRTAYIETYEKYQDLSVLSTDANDIEIEISNGIIKATSRMKIINRNDTVVDRIALYINPGLKVDSLTLEQQPVGFVQENQVILVDRTVQPGDTIGIMVRYSGEIDENICYTDIEDKAFYSTRSLKLFRYGKHYTYNGPAYIMFTPENMWYPTTIPLSNPVAKYGMARDFIDFNLKVSNIKDRMILSQGDMEQDSLYTYYSNSQKLIGISLIASEFTKKSIVVDSVEFSLYSYKNNDIYSKPFSHLADTLPILIKEIMGNLETKYGMRYPYRKFSIVEVPLHFSTYVRNWKGYAETIQPEMIFLPEKGVTLNMDLERMKTFIKRYYFRNEEEDEAKIETELFRMATGFISGGGRYGKGQGIFYDISPNYSTFIRYFHSNAYPMFDIVLTHMQNPASLVPINPWRGVINNTQRASVHLNKMSLENTARYMSLKGDILNEVIKLKAAQLQGYIKSRIKPQEFNRLLKNYMTSNLFNVSEITPLIDSLRIEYDLEISPYLEQWYKESGCPEFLITNANAFNVKMEDATEYLISFKIKNVSDVDAVISATVGTGMLQGRSKGVSMKRHFIGGSSLNQEEREKNTRYYFIPAHSIKECKIITEEQPNNLTVLYNITNNLPAGSTSHFAKIEEFTTDTIEGIWDVKEDIFTKNEEEGVTIIDNTSPGFKLISVSKHSRLKDYLIKKSEEEEDEYQNFGFWHSPKNWVKSVNSSFYGDIVKDAFYKARGIGRNSAEWNFYNVTPGRYDISVWNFGPQTFRGMNYAEINYKIKSETEEEEIPINLLKYQQGWVSLGEFELPEGNITLSLSDKTSAPYLVADAVKFTLIIEKQKK